MTLHRILAAGALLALAGCATDDAATNTQTAEAEKPDPRQGEEVRRLCFASTIDGFGETTRNTIVVSEGRDQYLIETYRGCFDLQDAQSIHIDSTLSCLTRGDHITPFDSVFGYDSTGISPMRCTVKAIYKWDEDAEEAAGEETVESETDDLKSAASAE